jgi:hypothetical protein
MSLPRVERLTILILMLCPIAAALAQETIYTRASLFTGEPEPVVVWNRTITEYRASIAGVAAAERAERSADRIAALPFESLSGSPIRSCRSLRAN